MGREATTEPWEVTLRPAAALRSVVAVVGYLVAGRLRHPRGRVGSVLSTTAGQRFVVYRETTVDPPPDGRDGEGAVLAFRFHLRLMPAWIRPIAVAVFEPLSILTTPFFAGLPGFRTKLWCFDHASGDYLGVYQWRSAAEAERYARSLRRLMGWLSVPGTVAYEVVDGAALSEYVGVREPPGTGEGGDATASG